MPVKNTLLDLNNILFEAIERINDDDLQGESLQDEIKRAKEIANLGEVIVSNAKVNLDAIKFAADYDVQVPQNLLRNNKTK